MKGYDFCYKNRRPVAKAVLPTKADMIIMTILGFALAALLIMPEVSQY